MTSYIYQLSSLKGQKISLKRVKSQIVLTKNNVIFRNNRPCIYKKKLLLEPKVIFKIKYRISKYYFISNNKITEKIRFVGLTKKIWYGENYAKFFVNMTKFGKYNQIGFCV